MISLNSEAFGNVKGKKSEFLPRQQFGAELNKHWN